ncbi:MAG: glutaredoxin 3 [Rhodospirillaceae bacterium]|nr:MAG: glutaredoxin 3 [Rhodospirillaceae bacterium]
MTKVEIYTTPTCPYCYKAKQLLKAKGVVYLEIDVASQSDVRDIMTRRAGGRRSVPQIFIDERHVGGCDDLHALEARGGLDPLLKGTAS